MSEGSRLACLLVLNACLYPDERERDRIEYTAQDEREESDGQN